MFKFPPVSEETAEFNHPRKSYSTGSLGVVSEPSATAAEIEAALNDVEKQIMLETKVRLNTSISFSNNFFAFCSKSWYDIYLFCGLVLSAYLFAQWMFEISLTSPAHAGLSAHFKNRMNITWMPASSGL